MTRKDWNRIGIAAAVVLVPGGVLLGAALAVRRLRAPRNETDTLPAPDRAADKD